MGNSAPKERGPKTLAATPAEPEKKLKPCCACPETRKPRDACIVERGEENCGELIEAHKTCMRNLGFNV